MDPAAALTSRQRGLITRAQAIAVGLSDAGIAHRVRRGTWIRVQPGLYLVVGVPRTWEHDVLGAVLLAGGPAWASHGSAARLAGYSGFEDARVEITVPLDRRVRVQGCVAHRSRMIDPADLRVIAGIPTMSPARTIVDLSSRLSVDALARMVDDGLRRGVLTIRALDSAVRRFTAIAPGRSPKKLERVLRNRVPGYHPDGSPLERRVLDAIAAAGLPLPVQQHKVVIGEHTYYIDLAYPERLVAIEVDGYDVHRGRGSFDADRRRQNDLVRAGWTVLRFTSTSTVEQIVADVTQVLFGRSSRV